MATLSSGSSAGAGAAAGAATGAAAASGPACAPCAGARPNCRPRPTGAAAARSGPGQSGGRPPASRWQVIAGRKTNPSEASYTSGLFARGINKVAQKVGEEAVELVIEAKDDNKDLFMGEAADLLFHYLILLEAIGYELDEVMEVLIDRHQKK